MEGIKGILTWYIESLQLSLSLSLDKELENGNALS